FNMCDPALIDSQPIIAFEATRNGEQYRYGRDGRLYTDPTWDIYNVFYDHEGNVLHDKDNTEVFALFAGLTGGQKTRVMEAMYHSAIMGDLYANPDKLEPILAKMYPPSVDR